MSKFNRHTYAFFDFGCGRGGSMVWAQHLFYGPGLGFDKSASRVEEAIQNGLNAVHGDILTLPDEKFVDFVVMSHFLEHLVNRGVAEQMIRKAVAVARKFVVIVQPFFDADDLLASQGLKFYWSDWPTGHRYKMASRDLIEILSGLKMINDFVVGFRIPIKSSASPTIHSIHSPCDQHEWIAGQHPPKPMDIQFKNIFRETLAYISIAPGSMSQIDKLQIEKRVH